jgi:hypothetical protein
MRTYSKLFAHIKQDNKGGRTPAENVKVAEKLAKGNKGVLQNCGWLRQNGYNGLDHCMRKFPKLFKHIPQLKLDSKGRAL